MSNTEHTTSAQTGAGASTGVHTDTGTGGDAGNSAGTGTDAGTAAGADAGAGAGTSTSTGTGTSMGMSAQAAATANHDDTTDLAHVHQMWAADDASRELNIELVEVGLRDGLGYARARMPVTERQINGHHVQHGGYIFTFADSTFALACNASGQLTVAAGADINFVAAGRLGDVLVAEARERARYGRSGITDITVTREADGALIAEFRGRSRSLPGGR